MLPTVEPLIGFENPPHLAEVLLLRRLYVLAVAKQGAEPSGSSTKKLAS